MNKPLILIPTPVQDEQRRSFSMGKGYIASLIAAGGVPLMVPVTLPERDVRVLYETADAVMLAGGGDIDPVEYGEEKHEKTSNIDADRDRAEFIVSRWAVADDKPLLGICRGIQSLNVAFGGSLVQDIPSQWQTTLRHNGHYEHARRDEVLHTVAVEPGSCIAAILGSVEVGVNSFHHQAVGQMAPGFIVTANSPDGLIEAIEWPGKRFVVGVQWHPEEMSFTRQDMLDLFRAFVNATVPTRH
ncbi:MAG: gamma-glutamyl-gamma-aminobutyrate hydrolase family protein [Chloroflexi bacterium]|nr:gamma-glutamyl-gamma-aminobutyrate hydrolase family protein [Chloroflexota bacterium]